MTTPSDPTLLFPKFFRIHSRLLELETMLASVREEIGELRLKDFEGTAATAEAAEKAEPTAAKAPEESADPTRPRALRQSEVNKAAAYRFHHKAMPDWLPIIGEADRKRITRAVDAFAEAAKVASANVEPKSDQTTKAHTVEFGSLLPKPGEPWSTTPKKTFRRMSYHAALEHYRSEHGAAPVDYVIRNILGDLRTAKALHEAFADFLGTHPDAASAGAAFARAHRRTLKSEGEAIGQLRLARHQVAHADGSISIWSPCVKPGDVAEKKSAQPSAALERSANA